MYFTQDPRCLYSFTRDTRDKNRRLTLMEREYLPRELEISFYDNNASNAKTKQSEECLSMCDFQSGKTHIHDRL